jgi:ribonuclease R
MLPERISNDLCSLREGKDRPAIAVRMTFAADGRKLRHSFHRVMMRSAGKLSYSQAQAAIDGAPDEVSRPLLETVLQPLWDGYAALRRGRQARRPLELELPERRILLKDDGTVDRVIVPERLDAHRLIEEFMLLANETIARRAAKSRLPFLYRVHEPPDSLRMEQVLELASNLGLRVRARPDPRPKDLQRVLASVRGEPIENLISTAVLRSMKQARYSQENLGHFGLATRHYTHFTSPIRRYPDLVVHRLAARAFIDHERIPDELREETLPGIARLTSERERVAVEAERDSVDLKKVEFMERHLGDAFDGTISGVTSFGVFVLLDAFFVEGLVHVSSMEDDYYLFIEEQYALIGERTRRRLQLGDRVRVQVASVDREERQIDFLLSAHPIAGSRRGDRERASVAG